MIGFSVTIPTVQLPREFVTSISNNHARSRQFLVWHSNVCSRELLRKPIPSSYNLIFSNTSILRSILRLDGVEKRIFRFSLFTGTLKKIESGKENGGKLQLRPELSPPAGYTIHHTIHPYISPPSCLWHLSILLPRHCCFELNRAVANTPYGKHNISRTTRVKRLRSVTVYRLPIRLPAKSALTWPVV